MNIDILQLLQRCGIECPPPTPINNPGFIPNLRDLRLARQIQPMVPTEGTLPPMWDEGCGPIETWYLGYLYSHALIEGQYVMQVVDTLEEMVEAQAIPAQYVDTVKVVVEHLRDTIGDGNDLVYYEILLRDISNKLSAYYQPPTSHS